MFTLLFYSFKFPVIFNPHGVDRGRNVYFFILFCEKVSLPKTPTKDATERILKKLPKSLPDMESSEKEFNFWDL